MDPAREIAQKLAPAPREEWAQEPLPIAAPEAHAAPLPTETPAPGATPYAFDAAEWAFAYALTTEVRALKVSRVVAMAALIGLGLIINKVGFNLFTFSFFLLPPIVLLQSQILHALARRRAQRHVAPLARVWRHAFEAGPGGFTLHHGDRLGEWQPHDFTFAGFESWLVNERFAAFVPRRKPGLGGRLRRWLALDRPVLVLRQALRAEQWAPFVAAAEQALGKPKQAKPIKTLLKEEKARQSAQWNWGSWGKSKKQKQAQA